MIGYASRTGTKRNLAVLRDAGWRLLISARGVLRNEGFPYALDNGAWTAHQRGEAFDEPAFVHAYDLFGADADWVVAPDIVAGGVDSLRFSERWLPRLTGARLVLIAVQDGMAAEDVAPLLGKRCGIFVGGTTEWKERTAVAWGELARKRGAYLHVGRVNSARRISICHEAQADSFDGTSVSRFAKSLPRLDRATRQPAFRWGTP